jgi:hypothetical protein
LAETNPGAQASTTRAGGQRLFHAIGCKKYGIVRAKASRRKS